MFGGFELVSHYFVLEACVRESLGLEYQKAGHYCD